jgi:hypothetical protein
LKEMERVTPVLKFQIAGAEVRLEAIRQDTPPKLTLISYEIVVGSLEIEAHGSAAPQRPEIWATPSSPSKKLFADAATRSWRNTGRIRVFTSRSDDAHSSSVATTSMPWRSTASEHDQKRNCNARQVVVGEIDASGFENGDGLANILDPEAYGAATRSRGKRNQAQLLVSANAPRSAGRPRSDVQP